MSGIDISREAVEFEAWRNGTGGPGRLLLALRAALDAAEAERDALKETLWRAQTSLEFARSQNHDIVAQSNEWYGQTQALKAERDKLRAALQLAMKWIEGWDPGFTLDDAWPDDHATIRAALAQPKPPQAFPPPPVACA